MYGVAYGNGVYVVVGGHYPVDSPGIISSANGNVWVNRTAANTSHTFKDVTYSNGLFVAVGPAIDNPDGICETSPDGTTWTQRALASNPSQYDSYLHSVTYGAGLFLAVETASGTTDYQTSPDGITWTLHTSPNTGLYTVYYG